VARRRANPYDRNAVDGRLLGWARPPAGRRRLVPGPRHREPTAAGSIRIPASCCGAVRPSSPFARSRCRSRRTSATSTVAWSTSTSFRRRSVRDFGGDSSMVPRGPRSPAIHTPRRRSCAPFTRRADDADPAGSRSAFENEAPGARRDDRRFRTPTASPPCRHRRPAARVVRPITSSPRTRPALRDPEWDAAGSSRCGAVGVTTELDECSHSIGRTIRQHEVEPLTWGARRARPDDLGPPRTTAAWRWLHHTTRANRRSSGEAYDLLLTPTLAEPPVPLGTPSASTSDDPLAAIFPRRRTTRPFTPPFNATGPAPRARLPL